MDLEYLLNELQTLKHKINTIENYIEKHTTKETSSIPPTPPTPPTTPPTPITNKKISNLIIIDNDKSNTTTKSKPKSKQNNKNKGEFNNKKMLKDEIYALLNINNKKELSRINLKNNVISLCKTDPNFNINICDNSIFIPMSIVDFSNTYLNFQLESQTIKINVLEDIINHMYLF